MSHATHPSIGCPPHGFRGGRFILALLLAMACMAMPTAQADTDDEVAALKSRVKTLELQVQLLQLQMKELRRELAEMRGESVVGGSPNGANVKPPVKPIAKPDVTKRYNSVIGILRDLPPSLQPTGNNGWDATKVSGVKDWISEALGGQKFQARLKLERVQLARNPKGFEEGQQPWHVNFYFLRQEMKYEGVTVVQKVSDRWPQPIMIPGDDDFARAATKLKRGSEVDLEGEIDRVTLGAALGDKRDMIVQLRSYTLEAKGLPKGE